MTSHVHAFEAREGGSFRISITIRLAEAEGGTDVLAVPDGLPRGVPTADNEAGWREALAKRAALVEPDESRPRRTVPR
jgi:hypothetical protein